MSAELPRHFRLLLDIADEPILLLQPDGRILGASEAMAESLNRPGDDLQGRSLYELITSSHDAAGLLLRGAAASRQRTVGALAFRNARGEDILCRVHGRLVQPASDDLTAIVSLGFRMGDDRPGFGELDPHPAEEAPRRLKSIEEARRQAEQAVRRERDFSDAVIKSLPGIFYMYDEQLRFIRWNDNFERVSGRASEDVAAMRPIDFFAGDDRARVKAAIDRVFQFGEASLEADFITADDRRVPYYFTGVALEIDGEKKLVGIGIDLTERRRAEAARGESEARYRALFDCAPDGFLIADLDGRYLDANPSICGMLGRDRDELIGLDASYIVVESEIEQIEPALEAIKTTAGHYREWMFRRKDGSTFPAEVVATLLPYGAVVAMIRDTTERRRAQAQQQEAENALRDMRSEFARIGRLSMLGEFAATVAHEVNQPLAAIAANSAASLRWLSALPPNLDEAREALNRITRDAHRAHEVIKRTRAMVVRGEPDHADVDLNQAIREVVLMAKSERKKSDASVVEALAANLPLVRGNRIELQQVVLNLLLNGLEATRGIIERERILVIRTNLASPEMAHVAVQDTGAGFDGAAADRLFEQFYTTKTGGTGLGLSISRSIVEAHGGRLWATPATPWGAIFQFTIPVAGLSPR